jgi:hypothetical protein
LLQTIQIPFGLDTIFGLDKGPYTSENHTDVLNIEVELLVVRETGNDIEAVVLFDTLMREERTAHRNTMASSTSFSSLLCASLVLKLLLCPFLEKISVSKSALLAGS